MLVPGLFTNRRETHGHLFLGPVPRTQGGICERSLLPVLPLDSPTCLAETLQEPSVGLAGRHHRLR